MPDPDPASVDLGHALALPPREAIEYFGAKGFRSSHDWREVWQDAHARAFTVAKMARFDLLASTRQRIDAKLRSGATLRDVERDLEQMFRAEGWWGKQIVSDDAGAAEVVQLGSPWRIRTIVRTNVAAAYNAGRYRRQVALRDERPYWQYLAVRDAASRPSHAAMHGKVFRADDPVWDTIYPANGFGCRCRVRALTERQVRRRGLTVIGDARSADVLQEVGVDKRTGEPITRPGTRIEWTDSHGRPRKWQPDPGWSHNPGLGALVRDKPADRIWPVEGQPTWETLGLPSATAYPRKAPAPPLLREASSAADARAIVHAALGLSPDTPRRRVRTPVDEVLLSRRAVRYWAGKQDRERYANRILPTLTEPDEVWMPYFDDGTFRARYVRFYDDARAGGALSVVTESPDGQLLANSIPMSDTNIDVQRVGVLLFDRLARDGRGGRGHGSG